MARNASVDIQLQKTACHTLYPTSQTQLSKFLDQKYLGDKEIPEKAGVSRLAKPAYEAGDWGE